MSVTISDKAVAISELMKEMKRLREDASEINAECEKLLCSYFSKVMCLSNKQEVILVKMAAIENSIEELMK